MVRIPSYTIRYASYRNAYERTHGQMTCFFQSGIIGHPLLLCFWIASIYGRTLYIEPLLIKYWKWRDIAQCSYSGYVNVVCSPILSSSSSTLPGRANDNASKALNQLHITHEQQTKTGKKQSANMIRLLLCREEWLWKQKKKNGELAPKKDSIGNNRRAATKNEQLQQQRSTFLRV